MAGLWDGGVDVSRWNLAVAGAVAACGPTVDGADAGAGETEGGEPCLLDAGCDEGKICVDELCVPGERPEEPPYDYGDPDCVHEDMCPEYPMQCIDDEDCAFAEICEHNVDEYFHNACVPAVMTRECASMVGLIPLPVELDGNEDAVVLRFVHADGDAAADLAIVRGSGVDIAYANALPSATRVIARGGVNDVTSGDFDRDAIRDLVVAHGDGLTLYVGDDAGAFTAVHDDTSVVAQRVIGLAWNTPLFEDDVAMLDLNGVVLVLEGPSLEGLRHDFGLAEARDLVIVDFEDDGADSIAAAVESSVSVLAGPSERHDFDTRGEARVVAGRFDDDGEVDVVAWAYTTMPLGWTLLEPGARALPFTAITADAGDVDGDGRDDIVFTTDDGVAIYFVGSECYGTVAGYTGAAVAVADVDADGREEIAIGNSDTVVLLATR